MLLEGSVLYSFYGDSLASMHANIIAEIGWWTMLLTRLTGLKRLELGGRLVNVHVESGKLEHLYISQEQVQRYAIIVE